MKKQTRPLTGIEKRELEELQLWYSTTWVDSFAYSDVISTREFLEQWNTIRQKSTTIRGWYKNMDIPLMNCNTWVFKKFLSQQYIPRGMNRKLRIIHRKKIYDYFLTSQTSFKDPQMIYRPSGLTNMTTSAPTAIDSSISSTKFVHISMAAKKISRSQKTQCPRKRPRCY